jgi:SAM-dependent methyltransferase
MTANPKLRGRGSTESSLYPFYAGFSEDFARSALRSISLSPNDWVLDPWIGSGTTAFAAASLGINALGYDLNPVMAVVAKARCAYVPQPLFLKPVVERVLGIAARADASGAVDPLSTWLRPGSVAAVRGVELGIQSTILRSRHYAAVKYFGVERLSDLAAFFYVALFRTVKQLLRPFFSSNPTWIKRPRADRERLGPSAAMVRKTFRQQIEKMVACIPAPSTRPGRVQRLLGVASSERLPLKDGSVGCVLGSPPYCTRIDYAIATSPELAVLGFDLEFDLDGLRRRLIGTPTVPAGDTEPTEDMGGSCLRFLKGLRRHSSKASSTYYYKNHVQYFLSLRASLIEIRRVLRPGGWCVLVVQDSYYKDLHNDLPRILTDMAVAQGYGLSGREDFHLSRTLAGINQGSQEYRKSFTATESVLRFRLPDR